MTRRDVVIGLLAGWLLVLLSAAVVASALGPPPHRPRQVKELDHYRYIALAESLPGRPADPGTRERPFCYRVLAPALVQALAGATGASVHAAFWASSMAFLAAYLAALFLWLRSSGFATALALVGTVLAGLTPGAVRWYAYQYWMPDPLCLLLVTLGLLLARRRRTAVLAILGVAGLLTRETYVLVPAWAAVVWLREDGLRHAARRFVLAFAPGLAAWLLLRLMVEAQGGPSLVEAAREMLAFRARHVLDNQLYFASLGSFGVLVPLLLLRLTRAGAALRARPADAVLVLLAYGSLAFANNTDRLLVYALPMLLPPALRTLLGLEAVWGRAAAVALVLGTQAWFYAVTPGWGVAGLSVYQPVRWSVVTLCGALLAAGLVALRRRDV